MTHQDSIKNVEQEIIELEKQWATAVQNQDSAQMNRFLSESYFLAKSAQGQPLQITSREAWLENLRPWVIESFHVDDVCVHTYGETAVVLMLITQKATFRGQDRSAQLMITDIWVTQTDGWRVAERHLGR